MRSQSVIFSDPQTYLARIWPNLEATVPEKQNRHDAELRAIARGDDTGTVRFNAEKRAMLVECHYFRGGQHSCRQHLQHNVNTLFGSASKRGKQALLSS